MARSVKTECQEVLVLSRRSPTAALGPPAASPGMLTEAWALRTRGDQALPRELGNLSPSPVSKFRLAMARKWHVNQTPEEKRFIQKDAFKSRKALDLWSTASEGGGRGCGE